MSNIVLSQAKRLAESFGIEGDAQEIVSVLKATAFRSDKGEVSDAQLAALLIVAGQYGLNPWTKEIYAFPDKKNGIVPVVGVDGWSRIINDHPQFDGMEFRVSENMVRMPGANVDAHEWMECIIYRKDRSRPTVVREYLDEVYREPFKGQYGVVAGPWQTHTKRFHRHKTSIQSARLAFGFGGIFDQDEAERIVEGQPAAKHMGMVEIVEPAAPATWPDDSFKARLPKWQAAVNSGSDVEEIVKFARSKGALTAEQEAAIRALKPQEQQQGPTFDQVAQQLRGAADADALNVAADLIGSITDPAQQAELNAIYETRMDEMSA